MPDERTVALYRKDGVKVLVPRYRVAEWLAAGCTETPPQPQPVMTEIPPVEVPYEPPIETRVKKLMQKARRDLRTVSRDDLIAVARFHNIDPPDRASKPELLALILRGTQ